MNPDQSDTKWSIIIDRQLNVTCREQSSDVIDIPNLKLIL